LESPRSRLQDARNLWAKVHKRRRYGNGAKKLMKLTDIKLTDIKMQDMFQVAEYIGLYFVDFGLSLLTRS